MTVTTRGRASRAVLCASRRFGPKFRRCHQCRKYPSRQLCLSQQKSLGAKMGDSWMNAESFKSIYELSRLLNTGLDQDTLAILLQLLEQGVNPEQLAEVVRDLRQEAERAQHAMGDAVSAAAVDYSQRQFEPPQQEPMKKRRSDYNYER